jgi:hypothetical protein
MSFSVLGANEITMNRFVNFLFQQDLTDSQESECDSIKNQTPSKMQVEDYSTHEPQSDFIKTQTPSKRSVGDSGANEPESGKLSSTRIRLRSVIKKEKSGLPPAI